MHIVNISSIKKCAFCKHWYDPTNQFITPRNPAQHLWAFDSNAKCPCLLKNISMQAGAFCLKYEPKI